MEARHAQATRGPVSGVLKVRSCTPPSGWMSWLGDVSYPLFLLHIPVFIVLSKAGLQSASVFLAAAASPATSAVVVALPSGLQRAAQASLRRTG